MFCNILQEIINNTKLNTTHFSNFDKSWKGRHFTIKTFQILNLLLTYCLLREIVRFIKASTWYLWSWKLLANDIGFWQILLKKWKSRHFTVNGHSSFKPSGKTTFCSSFQKLVLNCWKLVLNSTVRYSNKGGLLYLKFSGLNIFG